jgi:hypothetical protein
MEEAKNKGSLPEAGDIIADPDMVKVNNAVWFLEFIESLAPKAPEPVVEEKTEVAEEIESPKAEAVASEPAPDVQDEAPAEDDHSENQLPVRE